MVDGHLKIYINVCVCACECHLIINKKLFLTPKETPLGEKVKLFVFNLEALFITVVEGGKEIYNVMDFINTVVLYMSDLFLVFLFLSMKIDRTKYADGNHLFL